MPYPLPENTWQSASIRRIAGVVLALGMLCAAIYGNTRNAPFVFDDIVNITKNPHIRLRELSLSSLAEIFRNYSGNRPMANFSFACNYYLHRYDVAGYHVVNWIIHLINGLLVYLLTRQTLRLLKTNLPAAPFLAAALWLANPVHTQSVTYIVQRMNALAAMFYLASLTLYIRARTVPTGDNRRRKIVFLFFFLSAAAGICALASKQNAVTLPVMIFLYEWFFVRNLEAGFLKKQTIGLLVVAAAVTVTTFIYLGSDPIAAIRTKYATMPFTMGERLLTQPRVILHYLSLLLLPLPERLNIDHYVTISNSLTDPPATMAALAFLLSAMVMAVVKARSNRLFSFAVLWFLGTLAVESSFIGLEMMFEHRTYLPSVFLFIAATCILVQRVRPGWLATGTLTLLIIVSGFWTRQRNAVWADEVRFWQDAISKAPRSIRLYNNLGVALAFRGRYEEAIAACRQSIALSLPVINTTDPYNNIAKLYHQLGDNEKAIEFGRRAWQINPGCAETRMILGEVMLAENRLDEAITHLEASIRLDTWLTPAYTMLAQAYYQKTGDIDQSVDLCRRALTVDPESLTAEGFLGALLQHAGHPRQALPHLQRVLDKFPTHPQANLNAGIALRRLNRPEEAIVYLTRTAAAWPDHAQARIELGSALMAVNRLDEARTYFIQALDLSPDDPIVLTKLAAIMEQRQQWKEAAHYYQKALAAAPDSPHCLNQLAVVLARDGRFEEAATILEKLEKLLPDAPTVSFNLACLHARQNQPDKAVRHLEKALKKGYNDWEALRTDTDLEAIRNTPFYKKLIPSLEK